MAINPLMTHIMNQINTQMKPCMPSNCYQPHDTCNNDDDDNKQVSQNPYAILLYVP